MNYEMENYLNKFGVYTHGMRSSTQPKGELLLTEAATGGQCDRLIPVKHASPPAFLSFGGYFK